jgi:hypothetical protein
MLRRLKGQSTLEYAMIIAVVVGALLAMQIYMKRGVQGKLRESTDEIGTQFDAEKTSISRTVNRTGTTTQTVVGGVTTTTTTGETHKETGKDVVGTW